MSNNYTIGTLSVHFPCCDSTRMEDKASEDFGCRGEEGQMCVLEKVGQGLKAQGYELQGHTL